MKTIEYRLVPSTGTVDWSSADPFTVLVPSIGASNSATAFERHVQRPVAAVIEDLRQLTLSRTAGTTTARTVAILLTPVAANSLEETAAIEGLFEALRGVVGSLTLELAPSGLRLNLVRALATDDARDTLQFLATDDAAFVAGSTIDLTVENRS